MIAKIFKKSNNLLQRNFNISLVAAHPHLISPSRLREGENEGEGKRRRLDFTQKGFGLIEILLVVTVGMAVFLGIEQYLNISLKAAIEDSHQTEALYWAKANLEQARAVRDEDWDLISGLTPGNQYTFIVNSAVYPVPKSWEVQTGTRPEGHYTVWFTTSQVNRDATSDDIVAVGGVVDLNTLKINSNVSWLENGATKTVSVSEYLTNFK